MPRLVSVRSSLSERGMKKAYAFGAQACFLSTGPIIAHAGHRNGYIFKIFCRNFFDFRFLDTCTIFTMLFCAFFQHFFQFVEEGTRRGERPGAFSPPAPSKNIKKHREAKLPGKRFCAAFYKKRPGFGVGPRRKRAQGTCPPAMRARPRRRPKRVARPLRRWRQRSSASGISSPRTT